MMKKSVLLVYDENSICQMIKEAMHDETTEVHDTPSDKDALSLYLKRPYCLVIMAVAPPEIDRTDLIKTMRQAKSTPILVLTPVLSSAQRILLLTIGASVCLEKTNDPSECLLQAQALIQIYTCDDAIRDRRYTLAFGQNLVIDPTYWRVTIHGVSLELTRKEFGLLYCLAKHRGQVLTKEQLYRHVWNCESDINLEATIKSHIRTLRQKLHPRGKDYIESIRGVGYRFNGNACE